MIGGGLSSLFVLPLITLCGDQAFNNSFCLALSGFGPVLQLAILIIALPVARLAKLFEPVFHYTMSHDPAFYELWSIPFWILAGALIGAIISVSKSIKKNTSK